MSWQVVGGRFSSRTFSDDVALFTEANVVLPSTLLQQHPKPLMGRLTVFWVLALIGNFVGSLKSRLSDLFARDRGVGYTAPVILGPKGAAQSNRMAHTLLPSLPVKRCTLRATPPIPPSQCVNTSVNASSGTNVAVNKTLSRAQRSARDFNC